MRKQILSIIRNIEYKRENAFELAQEKRIFIACVQNHGNLGDQALTLAAKKMVSTYLSDYHQVELTVSNLLDQKFIDSLEVRDSDVVIIQGGGFLGNLWMDIYTALINTIRLFKNNQIIIFPQSYSFTNDDIGNLEAKKMEELFLSVKRLDVFARDEISYDLMKKHFSKFKNIYLCPDSVFYLKNDINLGEANRSGALFLLRSDKEKKLTEDAFNTIYDIVRNRYDNISFSDTVISGRINKKNRRRKVLEKLTQISEADLVVTDRLHGMIFAYLTNTKCIVLPNNNHKIKGAYNFIKNCSYILFLDDVSKFSDSLDKINHGKIGDSINEKYEVLFKVLERVNND